MPTGGIRTRTSGIMVPAFVAPVSTYTAQGVRFDGTNDYMESAGSLSGVADGKQGILSFWIKMMGGDGVAQFILEDDPPDVVLQFIREVGNVIRLNLANTSAYFAVTTNTFVSGGAWRHFIAAWDLAATTVQVYVDGVVDPMTISAGPNNVNVPWTSAPNWGFAQRASTHGFLLNAEVADFYLNTSQYLDISNPSNLAKFRSATGHPVDLGATGSIPTGTAPTIFFHGPTASWQTNDGTGGGFNLTGTLTDATTNP